MEYDGISWSRIEQHGMGWFPKVMWDIMLTLKLLVTKWKPLVKKRVPLVGNSHSIWGNIF